MIKKYNNNSCAVLCTMLSIASLLYACHSKTDKVEVVTIHDTVTELVQEPGPIENLSAPDTLFADGTRPSSWSSAGFTDPAAFKKFMMNWKTWVQTGMKDSILAYTHFPLPAYKDKTAFLKAWPAIFTDEMKKKIEQQPLHEIFRNYRGAMIAGGAFWFGQLPDGYRLIGVNRP